MSKIVGYGGDWQLDATDFLRHAKQVAQSFEVMSDGFSRMKWSMSGYFDAISRTDWAVPTTLTTSGFDTSYSTYINAIHYNVTDASVTTDYNVASSPAPVRRRPPAGFNRYINASDLLEEFLVWLGTQRVRADELLQLPLELFIKWLVLRACEEDGEEPTVTVQVPKRRAARCLGCQRFMPRLTPTPFHGEHCALLYYRRLEPKDDMRAVRTHSRRPGRVMDANASGAPAALTHTARGLPALA